NSGTQISFALNDIQSITFPQSNIAVTKTDGNTSTYSFTDINYLSFSDFTTGVNSIVDREEPGLQLFPNPVSNRLRITFSSEKNEKVQLSVINLQGKVLQQQNISCHEGTNLAEMPVADLKQGIYLFRFQNQEKTETIKFLKN
ncbi:MAG: T9SS type A sorting domain-containing protein, partial [Mariniphaga sp.]